MSIWNIQQAIEHFHQHGSHLTPLPGWTVSETYQRNVYVADLQEWLQCKDFVLGMKGIRMGHLPVNTDSLRHFKVSVNSVMASSENPPAMIAQHLNKFNNHWLQAIDAAGAMGNEVEIGIVDDLVKLKSVELSDKRKVLRHMQIVPTSIAAAYLGINEGALRKMKRRDGEVFGKFYAGGHCYSIEELNLIARNQHWTEAGIYADDAPVPDVNDTALDQVVMVDEQIARAFTDMSIEELVQQVPRTTLLYRPYRLADLEKMRNEKCGQKLA
jgi:hypothetical protein